MNRISTSIFVVTVACASIALHITISGPRLTGVTENNLAGTKSLVFHFNTKLDETQKPKFNVTPEVKNELRIGSDFIELTFIEPLKSGTHYTIEVGEIYDTRSKQTTIRYQFETSPQSIAYLQRNENDEDKIFLKNVGESNGKEIYSSEKIGDFIFTKNKLITIEETGERTYLYDATNHKQLAIPTGDPVALDGSNDSNIIVINTLDRSTFRRALFVYTLSDGRFKELMGNGNAPVDSSFSLLAPDGKTVIYQLSADGSTYVDDPFDDRDALNIGTINRVIGFLPAGNGLFIEKTFNTFGVLNPETGKFTETKQPLHVGSVIGLSKNSQVYIEYLFGNDPDGQNIILTRDNTTQTIYQNNGDTGQITDIRASTSREFIEIEFSPQPPIYDSYKTFSKPKDGAIILIDQQGNTIDQITASLIRWL